ncbi:MAG: hypothetical protein HY907_08380 [Deltaproteobacteria bacterium]|nr:hypothetical protein [Deltaproteobacteria bacterium]
MRHGTAAVLLAFALSCGESTGLPGGSDLVIGPDVWVPPECDRSAIAAYPTAADLLEDPAGPPASPPRAPADQQALFEAVVRAVSDDYVDPAFNGVDWPGIVASHRARVGAGMETETFYADLRDMISELGDEHSYFSSPGEVQAEQAALAGQNDFVGFGVYMLPLLEKDRAAVIAVLPGSPAERGGLAQHDAIVALNGFPLVAGGKSHPERLRGPECTGAVLTIQSPGQAPRELTMVRQRFSVPLPVYDRQVPTADGSRIGYVLLPTFLDSTVPQQLRDALGRFGPLDALIVDNRVNGGGSSRVLEPVLGLFASGTMGHFASRDGTRPLEIAADPIEDSQTVPLVVLIDEGTVSYGEIFAGVLQDIGRALLAGRTTLGNVEALHGFEFTDGSELWLAGERFVPLHSTDDWEATGIVPDAEAHADWDTFTFESDPVIAAALGLLGHS